MQKGIALCYTVVLITFYPVAISGYWAFGNQASGNIVDNLAPDKGPELLPTWLLGILSIAIVAQLLAIGLVSRYPRVMDVLVWWIILYPYTLHFCAMQSKSGGLTGNRLLDVGVFTTHLWSAGKQNWRCKTREVQYPKCNASSCLPVSLLGSGNALGGDASILRRHHLPDWSVWVYAAWLRPAHAVLPDCVPAIETETNLLVELDDYYSVHGRWGDWVHSFLPQHLHECAKVSFVRGCMKKGPGSRKPDEREREREMRDERKP